MKQSSATPEKKSDEGLLRPRNVFLVLLVVFAAACYQQAQRKSWFLAPPLTKEKFPSRPFEVKTIPTTYYQVGNIGEVLKGWHKPKGLEDYIHLYRPDPKGPKFEFDPSILASKTQVEKFMNPCDRVESVVCKTCATLDEHKMINISDLYATPSYYYSSFAKLDNVASIAELVKIVNIPGLEAKNMVLEHAFVGNFEQDKITAFFHANSLTSSMSIQFLGSKAWLFVSPQVMRDPEFLHSFPGTGIVIPTKGPSVPYDVYYYESQPGDVLFFSENWGHTVLTKAGPNFMLNFRKMELGNFLRRPFDWLHSMYNNRRYRPQHAMGRDSTPYNALLSVWMPKVNNLCAGNTRAPWDDDMTNLLLNGPPKKQ